jgi:O-methyltransferase involved in polyketide biosynthesis
MDEVNKTLYIPLYGKAWVSRQNIIIKDPMAGKIWESQGFHLGRRS